MTKLPYEQRKIELIPLFHIEGMQQEVITDPYRLVNELIEAAKIRTGQTLFAGTFDLDDTQFSSDIGMGTIMSIMHEESYWLKDENEYNFERNLKSLEFERAFGGAMTDENGKGLTVGKPGDKLYVSDAQELAKWAYNVLAPDLIEHHKRIKLGVKFMGFESQREEIADFCTKFHLLDAVTMKMEFAFSKYNPDKIVPRTRLTAGLNDVEINKAVHKMTTREHVAECKIKLTGKRIDLLSNIPGMEYQESLINETILINAKKTKGIFRIVRAIVQSGNIWHTISTGDHRIVRAVLEEGPFGDLLREQAKRLGCTIDDFIHATRHVIKNGIMMPEIDGVAILAEAKRRVTERIDKEVPVLIGAGDTGTDRLMNGVALKNSGKVIIVGHTLEEAQNTHDRHYPREIYTNQERANIYFTKNTNI
jgi:hypothetical protein